MNINIRLNAALNPLGGEKNCISCFAETFRPERYVYTTSTKQGYELAVCTRVLVLICVVQKYL